MDSENQQSLLFKNNTEKENQSLSEEYAPDEDAALIEDPGTERDKQLSLYQSLITLFARTPICFKIFYFLFVQYGHWLKGESVTQADESKLRRTVIVRNIFKGSDFFIENIATPIFLGLLIRDFVVYFLQPENRYGTTHWDILAGTATNAATWTGDRGFDVVTETHFYLTLAIIFGSWLSTIVLYSLCNRHWQPLYFSDDFSLDIATINPLSWKKSADHSMSLGAAETLLLWQASSGELSHSINNDEVGETAEVTQHLNGAQRQLLLNKIMDAAKKPSLKALVVLPVLAELAVHCPLNSNEAAEVWERRKLALSALQKAANWRTYPFALWYHLKANYLLWSLGHSKKILAHLVFWIYPLLVFYVKARFIEALVFKLIQVWYFFEAQKDCLDAGKQWLFMQVTDRYACSFCGDWDFIYYLDQFNAQKCLSGLFARVSDPQSLISYLSHFPKTQMETLDLSRQDFSSWSDKDWQTLLVTLSSVLISPLLALNLSTTFMPITWMNETVVNRLAAFITQFQVTQLDLSNQLLGAGLFDQFIASVQPHFFTVLNMSNNALGDTGAELFLQYGNFSRQLTVLNVDNNDISDLGMQSMAAVFTNSSLVGLSLQNNAFFYEGIEALCALISSSLFLQWLDFSENPLMLAGSKILGAVLPSSTLTTLRLSNVDMNDLFLAEVAQSINQTSLSTLDFSNNDLTGAGFLLLIQRLQDSMVQSLLLAGNSLYIQLNFVACLKNMMNTTVNFLDLTSTGLTSDCFNATEGLWSQTDIRYLRLAQNALTDAGAMLLCKALQGWGLMSLDLSDTLLTAQGALAVISALPTSLLFLDLSYNVLSPQVLYQLIKKFIDHSLAIISLSLENTHIDSASVQMLASILPAIKLQFLNVAKNILNDNALTQLASYLIKTIPQIDTIANQLITRDEKRALAKAISNTCLQQLKMDITQVGDFGARAICRVLPSANFSMSHLFLQGNPIDPTEVNIDSCYIQNNADAVEDLVSFMHRRDMLSTEHAAVHASQSFNLYSPLLLILLCAMICSLLTSALYYFRSSKFTQVTQTSIPSSSFWSKAKSFLPFTKKDQSQSVVHLVISPSTDFTC